MKNQITATKVLAHLRWQITRMPHTEYHKLCAITETANFVCLGERQIKEWHDKAKSLELTDKVA